MNSPIQRNLILKQKCFRRMYAGCKTCTPTSKLSLALERITIMEYINKLIRSLRLSRYDARSLYYLCSCFFSNIILFFIQHRLIYEFSVLAFRLKNSVRRIHRIDFSWCSFLCFLLRFHK
jgi:hypothetical protein